MVPPKKLPNFKKSLANKTTGIFSFISQKPFLALLIVALVPFIMLVAFTFKGGFDLPFGKARKSSKISVDKSPQVIE